MRSSVPKAPGQAHSPRDERSAMRSSSRKAEAIERRDPGPETLPARASAGRSQPPNAEPVLQNPLPPLGPLRGQSAEARHRSDQQKSSGQHPRAEQPLASSQQIDRPRQSAGPRVSQSERDKPMLAVPSARLVEVQDVAIGSGAVCWIGGPRYVESVAQLRAIAASLKDAGVRFLRARAWWPYAREEDFDRHLHSGLIVLRDTAREFGLFAVSEVVHIRHLDIMQRHCDVIEVGGQLLTHNLLLSELGGSGKTVMLNRAADMSVGSFLNAVELVASRAGSRVLLMESGTRALEPASEPFLDLSAIVTLRQETNHPVFVDPMAVCRMSGHVKNIALASIAAGADGIVAEVRPGENVCCSAVSPGAVGTPQLIEMIRHASAFKHTLNALALSSAAAGGAEERAAQPDNGTVRTLRHPAAA